MAKLKCVSTKTITPLIDNVRVRIIAVLGTLLLSISFLKASLLIWLCFGILIINLWCGVSVGFIFKRYCLIIPFTLGAVVFLPFTTKGELAFKVLAWSVSQAGLEKAINIFLKVTVANFLLTYLLATTATVDILKHLRSLGVPDLLIMIMQMMMRYFYLLVDEVQSMVKAQRARGLRLERWFWSPRVFIRFGELLGVLFIRAHVRSQKIYLAMTARGGFSNLSKDQEQIKHNKKVVAKLAIELQDVSFYYGDYKALHDVSFSIPRGTKMALLGRNGAGKSTLMALLNGLSEPATGKVLLFGEELTRKTRVMACQKVGVVYQDPDDQIFSATVEEDVAFGPRNLGLTEPEVEARVARALASVGLREFRKRSPFELSYGQKRRVAIAGVLAMQPEIIIMDEPMAFLDPQGRKELQALLESLHLMGMTIMIATHDIDFAAEWAERVLIMQDGSIYADGTNELLFDEQLLAGVQLPLPLLAQPFRLLRDIQSEIKPRSVREAAQWIWRLMVHQESKDIKSDEAS